MPTYLLFILAIGLLLGCTQKEQVYSARGVLKEIRDGGKSILIQHEEIPNYMPAMTMQLDVKAPEQLAQMQPGDEVAFKLHVTEDDSWVGSIVKTGKRVEVPATSQKTAVASTNAPSRHPLLDFSFTNQFGKPVKLSDFKGQALAITFIFTRCPIPEYCPRLSRNFEEAQKQLLAMTNGPTNWHLISVSFDPEFDTPAVLKSYAERYKHDPKHWTFLTGPREQIHELARLSDVVIEKDPATLFNHGFRTLIIDANGKMQMSFPIGGNLSGPLVEQIVKAATVPRTNSVAGN